MTRRISTIGIFLLITLLFCYFRLKPLYFQTVGYTYDQGRDFLKAAEIITEKNITFIGPTTGIPGVFHGAWYFYLLTVPFILFGGSPIGFYYFNFLLQLISFLILVYFLYRYFGFIPAAIVALLVASSPYFIFTSIFVGNNILLMPFFLLFLIVNYLLLRKETVRNLPTTLVINGLLLGFVTEFELAFGMFLIPAYFFTVLLVKGLRSIFFNLKNFSYFLVGFSVPFIPRLLFELKNNFFQTKAFYQRLLAGNPESPHTFTGALQERILLFFGYFRSVFAHELLLMIFVFVLILFVIALFENKVKKYDWSAGFFIALLAFIFFLSALYKDSFVWGNYFEGIQYVMLILLAIALSVVMQQHRNLIALLKIILLVFLFTTIILSFFKDLEKKPEAAGSLALQTRIVRSVQSNVKKGDKYCVKVYTPPIIPYTYNYLFLYERLSKKFPLPEQDWVNDQCWFIIEKDDNLERRQKWIDERTPKKNRILKESRIEDTQIVLYQIRN